MIFVLIYSYLYSYFAFVFLFVFSFVFLLVFISLFVLIKKPPSNALGGKSLFYLISFFSLLVAKDARAVFVKALDSALRAAYAERIFADKA